MNAAQIAILLGGSGPNSEGWYRCPCPAHGSQGPSLAIKDGWRHKIIAKCWAGCSNADVAAALRPIVSGAVPPPVPAAPPPLDYDVVATFRRRLHETTAIEGTLGERYLHGRGITLSLPTSLRFHSRLFHKESGRRFPALIAKVQDAAGALVAIHRTWLALNGHGKAGVTPDKMALGPVSGGAIRLGAGGDTLIVAEGVETALSAMQIFDLPAWATLSTSGMTSVVIPSEYQSIVIAADHDANGAGLRAAETLRRRLTRDLRKVKILKPEIEGQDFNDIVMNGEAINI